MGHKVLPKARIPVATYRVQFNRHFTFAAAREIVSYLHELGISDLYASSYVAAKKESLHGYDIVDHTSFNREVGTEETYDELSSELRRFDMGQIVDFVPNHMCIESSENAWWMDVLENGLSSNYAYFFDINWKPVKKELTNKVLLPFLADQYGNVLERGELHLTFEEGAFFVHYWDARLPVEPTTYLHILRHRLESINDLLPVDAPPLLELLSIITALQHLPSTTEEDPDKRGERYREKEMVKKRLWQLYKENPVVGGFIEENVTIFNGIKGEPRSFDLLDQLLSEQVYRLSSWRVATEEINYRRFFDINGLGAIRMENPAVFKETHTLLFRLIREGRVTGVRIDHVDGLYDPLFYLQKLQKGCFTQLRLAGSNPSPPVGSEAEAEKLASYGREYGEVLEKEPSLKPFYLVCEKILLKGEQLPTEWPLFGTTGYGFLNSLNGIFVETKNAKAFDRIYARFIKETLNFQEVAYEKKKLVMQVSLSGEVNTLGHYLNTISEEDRLTRDFTLNSLTRAITEVIACFPVYRTYVNSGTVREKDSQYIETAVAKAKRKNPSISASIFDFLRSVLLLRFPDHLKDGEKAEWLGFVMRFQQITGPVMAKGLEDTAFYVYNRLISLNDVGGMPDRFGLPLEAFHGQNLERLKSFPHALITTATHDTKRGEDVRVRIDALSELPEKWQKNVAKWARINRKKRPLLETQPVPDSNEEYLLYQILIGAWPFGRTDQAGYEAFIGRIREYMVKAAREAKINTSWINPNPAYEEALATFIDAILADRPDNEFLPEFQTFQKLIAHYGVFTSLAQMLLKIASPGVPDFYQGTELWDFSLVDPDNRRPVDYSIRIEALDSLKRREREIGPSALIQELVDGKEDGRIKLYLACRALNYRRENRQLFERGSYLPLESYGEKARNVCAFARKWGEKTVIAIVPRFMATLIPEPGMTPGGNDVWRESFLAVPDKTGTLYANIFTGKTVTIQLRGDTRVLSLAEAFAGVPVVLLETAGK